MVVQTNVYRVNQDDTQERMDVHESREPCPGVEEKSRCNAKNASVQSEFNGASDELAQMLKRRRSISPDQDDERQAASDERCDEPKERDNECQAASDERRDEYEERDDERQAASDEHRDEYEERDDERQAASDERRDGYEERDDSPRLSHDKMDLYSHLSAQTNGDDVVYNTSDADTSGLTDVQSIISEHLPPSSPHDKAGVPAAHRTMNLSTSNGGRRENKATTSLIAASEVNNKMDAALSMMEKFERLEADRMISAEVKVQKDRVLEASRDTAINSFATDESVHDANTKLDAALSMMQEFQRETADRKISSMMQVQKNVDEDYKKIRMPSHIDWETGEYDRTPWVGQVGLNDDIFEDEPLEDAEAGRDKHQSNKHSLSTISCERIVVHRKLLLTACSLFLIAGVLGWAASFVHKKKTAMCTLCYDGFTPNDLSASMVGGQTCNEFRSSVESLPALDKQCLQDQSLAWLMCDCNSLPPFPKKPSCTLCGAGVLLKGSACNHINTFMAHISDPDYCEALKSSVSKAGCSCPEEV
jgi:hypothetical protein